LARLRPLSPPEDAAADRPLALAAGLRHRGRGLHHDRQLEAEGPRRLLERRHLPVEQAPRVPEVPGPAPAAARGPLRSVLERGRAGGPGPPRIPGLPALEPPQAVARSVRLPGLLPALARRVDRAQGPARA